MKAKPMTISQRIESPRDHFHRGQRVPTLRIHGEWLEENGFTPGARVDVTVERGRIVVTLKSEA